MHQIIQLAQALLPLDVPPQGSAWNHSELVDILPSQPLRPAAVLIGLRPAADGLQIVLTRRTDALRHHAGQIAFPGGRIEDSDSSPIHAAVREACEEVGLSTNQTTPLGYLDPYVTITGFHVYPVVASIDSDFQARLDPSEVAEVFEVPLAFVFNRDNEKRADLDYRGIKRALIEFRWQHYRIWGATAAMLVNFRNRWEQSSG